MQGDALNADPPAAPLEFRRPMRLPDQPKFGKQPSRLRQGFQNVRQLAVEANQQNGFGLLTEKAHDPIRPIHILGGEIGNVGLGRAQMPAQFVKDATFRIGFRRKDFLVFFAGDATLFAIFDFGPVPLRQHRPRQPAHVQGKIMQLPKKGVRGNRSLVQHLQKMFRPRFQNGHIAN